MAWRSRILGGTAALVALAAVCTAAEAGAPQTAFMPIGRTVPPPRAFVDFCFREPGDCASLPAAVDRRDAAVSAEPRDMATAATSTYWRLVFDAEAPAALKRDRRSRGRDRASRDWLSAEATNPPPVAPPLAAAPGGRDLMADIDHINRSVNRDVRERSDYAVYGVKDYWGLPLEAAAHGQGDCEDYALQKRHALLALGYPESMLSLALVRTAWGQSHAVLLVSTASGEMVLDNLSSWIRPWQKTSYTWIMRQSAANPGVWVDVPA